MRLTRAEKYGREQPGARAGVGNNENLIHAVGTKGSASTLVNAAQWDVVDQTKYMTIKTP